MNVHRKQAATNSDSSSSSSSKHVQKVPRLIGTAYSLYRLWKQEDNQSISIAYAAVLEATAGQYNTIQYKFV